MQQVPLWTGRMVVMNLANPPAQEHLTDAISCRR